MSKSTRPKLASKPKKPHVDFPLYAHNTRRWAKKIRGRLHYFGPWEDPKGALRRYLDQKDDLLAGRTPRSKGDGLTVADLANHFLTFKSQLLDSGELASRTFDRYHKTCGLVVSVLGRTRVVEGLDAADFQGLRRQMAQRWGPVALANEIQIVRSIFRYGEEAGLIQKRVLLGPGFKRPSAEVLRQARVAKGPRLFTPEQIQGALTHSGPNMRAMILLGINGGLGNTDVALLPINAVDLKSRWLDYPRPKTGICRRVPLWPETKEAIREAITARREPSDPADADLLFIGPRGKSYTGNRKGYRVTAEFTRALRKAGIDGRTFYDLRRTFQTIGESAHDLVAVQSIMGHAPSSGDMSAVYRQQVDDDRLRAVTDHVRQWFLGPEEDK